MSTLVSILQAAVGRLSIALGLLLAYEVTAHAADLMVGQPAPVLRVQTTNSGELVEVGGGKGPVTIINLWATWCVPCREEMPALQSYYERHRGDGLRLIAISMDSESRIEEVRRVAASYGFTVGVKGGSDLQALRRIKRIPMTFVIDGDGVLRRDGRQGEPMVTLDMLEREVTPLLGAQTR